MKRKILWVIIILILAVASAGGYFYFQKWWGVKEQKIQMGLASDKFPWRDYTQEELNKMYPQIKYADVLTRVTPEETYAKFREALRTNNLEMAMEQLSKESKKYQENKADLEKAYKGGKFINIYNEYLEKLEKSYMYESIAQFYFIEK
ncbi:hypothetical protein KJ853_04370, partial [Patescibacteria group bacterium]|nr:hypothetical protein [Patescibacteria group bacterium]